MPTQIIYCVVSVTSESWWFSDTLHSSVLKFPHYMQLNWLVLYTEPTLHTCLNQVLNRPITYRTCVDHKSKLPYEKRLHTVVGN